MGDQSQSKGASERPRQGYSAMGPSTGESAELQSEAVDNFDNGGESVPVGGTLRAVRKIRRGCTKGASTDDDVSTTTSSGEEETLTKPAAAPETVMNAGYGVNSYQKVFKMFCGSRADMDGKTFSKLCKDCHLLDKQFTPTDADLCFAKAAVKGQRRITLPQFAELLQQCREKGHGVQCSLGMC